MSKLLLAQPFKCAHCNKSFMKEKTSLAHMCERKRRALQEKENVCRPGL
jgi:hypothetical protein